MTAQINLRVQYNCNKRGLDSLCVAESGKRYERKKDTVDCSTRQPNTEKLNSMRFVQSMKATVVVVVDQRSARPLGWNEASE